MSFAVNHLSNPISHFTEATKKAASSSSEKLSTGIKKAEDQFKRSNEPTIFHHGEVKPQAKMGLENQSILNAKKETVGHVSHTRQPSSG
jgi:hypothetical protein